MNATIQRRSAMAALLLAATIGIRLSAQSAEPTPAPATKAAPAPPISAEQAQKLFRSVDTILHFDSKDTGFAIHTAVKRRLVSRAEVSAYLRQQMADDKDTARMERSTLELEKLGLLPAHYDLKAVLLRLLDEQVAGFYDSKTKTVNLLDWVTADEQKPVLAHELCHALQDQFQTARGVSLDKWENAGPGSDAPTDVKADRAEIGSDETDTAREAVLEGQAMVTYLDWGLEGKGQTLRTLPLISADALSQAAGKDADSPELTSAPPVLRESLLFPYQEGLIFEQHVLQNLGTAGAFAGTLTRPPASSWEILHPEAYEQGRRAPVLTMPDLHPILDKEWAPYDVGVMGALDVRMLGVTLADVGAGADAAKGWDGGIYYAAQKRDATKEQKSTTASVALVYLSRWTTPQAAANFAKMYWTSLPKRYPGLEHAEQSAHRTVDSTSEGPAVIDQQGRYVFISHTLPVATANTVMAAMLAAQGVTLASHATPGTVTAQAHELTQPLRGLLARAGTLRADDILAGAH